ncbi:MAG: glutathione-disulfide reductase [Hyphomicrobiales bacterium]|nr:glutathione-disulfide reductase [Hyphomicrobiales bacterium]
MAYDYDLFVIGAGSGGVRAARISAQYGARVAIAEEYRIGGTCVIRGCVPKKLLVYASHYSDILEDAGGYGWTVEGARFDWATLIANKGVEIDRLSGIYEANLKRSNVSVFQARATLEDAHTIRLEPGGKTVTADKILIATGGAPFVPKFRGDEHAITSNEAFHLTELPRRVAIVGGGYIAVEFAGIFHGLGSEVSIIYRGPEILRGFDEDMRVGLTHALQAKGVGFHMNADISAIAQDGGALTASLMSGEILAADLVMFATGRKPATTGLGLDLAGLKLGMFGEVIVDEYSRSSVENIYAVGDVTNRVNLTPVAIREGHAFADTVFGGKPTCADYHLIPTAVFSQPEIGTVGLSEAEARRQFARVDIYKSTFRPMKHVLPKREERMTMKLVVDGETDRVVGCHILGPDAAEIVQIVAIPMRMGATKADFDATMALHPSAGEELVTMREKWTPPKEDTASIDPAMDSHE